MQQRVVLKDVTTSAGLGRTPRTADIVELSPCLIDLTVAASSATGITPSLTKNDLVDA